MVSSAEKRGKKLTKVLLSLITYCILPFLFTSCSPLHKFSYENDLYKDKKTGYEYYCAPIYFEPILIGEKYGTCNSSSDGTIYEIGGLDPSLWLCDYAEGLKTVFCSTDIILPSFKDFSPESFSIFISDSDRKFASCYESELINEIISLFDENESEDVPFDNSAMYYLKFESSKFPGIYYNIMAIHERDLGQIFIYDRGSKKTVDSGNLFYGVLPYTNSLKDQTNE